MLVEFVGAPGVGKSTIARLVTAQLLESGVHDARCVELTGYSDLERRPLTRRQVQLNRIIALTMSPRLATEVYRCWRAYGPGLALSWTVNLARRNHLTKRCGEMGGVTILEEAVLSALCLTSVARGPHWDFRSLLPSLVTADVVVSLRAPIETTHHRVVERRGILGDYSLEAFSELHRGYLLAQEALEASLQTPPLRFSTAERSPDEIADFVTSELLNGVLMRRCCPPHG